MPSRSLADRLTNHLDSDATQYADRVVPYVEAYRECPPESGDGLPSAGWAAPESRRWPGVIMLAGLGLLASFLLAFLTLNTVRSTDPVEPTPSVVVTRPITTETPGNQARQDVTQTVSVAPTRTYQPPMTTTGAPVPPATMTNPLEPPPATMTNPLEPPIGAGSPEE